MRYLRWIGVMVGAFALIATSITIETGNRASAEAPVQQPREPGKPHMTTRGGEPTSWYVPSSPAVVLYDQYDNADPFGSATSSQIFGAGFEELDNQLADDFIVPANQSWSVNQVDVAGYYNAEGAGPPQSINVYFYQDDNSLPGTPVITETARPFSGGPTQGSFTIPLDPVTLPPGHYWVSVQVNMEYETNGQWLWADRTVQSNSPAAWRNPGDGFETGCTDWDIKGTNCGGNEDAPDQLFRLNGTSGVVTPTPTITGTPPTATPTACATGNYTFTVTSGATIVPGTVDTLNHCVDCTTLVNFPFAYSFYDQTYTRARVASNGTLQFVSNIAPFTFVCLPDDRYSYAIFALEDDLDTGFICETGCGVYTSISGSAPNRIFNIEWRADFSDGSGHVNFEVRLYEGQKRFDLVYGQVDEAGAGSVVGVQRDLGSLYTQYECMTGGITSGLQVSFSLPGCLTSTVTPAVTSTPTSSVATQTSTPISTQITGTVTPGASPALTGTAVQPTATTGASSTPTQCTIAFSDVDVDNTFYAFIRCLACRGIISGYTDGTFQPGNDITRGQIAKMVSNAAGFSEDPGPQLYEDVPPASPFYAWINRLSMRGHMGGYPCGLVPEETCEPPDNRPYFRPNASATRGQLAKIVSNAAGLGGDPTGLFYNDVQEDHTFYVWIMRLTQLGVMSGYPCGGESEPCDEESRPYFRPFNDVTRGQASKIVANTFYPNCETPDGR
ncbi:MAG TPA: S-layer homology domain-containing protein [Chloroflexia bacterium]|nr:S-layer homology domain-containing protein [Chloroflexia bacterium]